MRSIAWIFCIYFSFPFAHLNAQKKDSCTVCGQYGKTFDRQKFIINADNTFSYKYYSETWYNGNWEKRGDTLIFESLYKCHDIKMTVKEELDKTISRHYTFFELEGAEAFHPYIVINDDITYLKQNKIYQSKKIPIKSHKIKYFQFYDPCVMGGKELYSQPYYPKKRGANVFKIKVDLPSSDYYFFDKEKWFWKKGCLYKITEDNRIIEDDKNLCKKMIL